MKENICVIGLYNNFVKSLAKSISDSFDMFFADITELVQFDLLDVDNARNLCGDDYVKKVENNKVKTISSYSNTLFTLDYSLLNNDDNLNRIKQSSYIIYLKLSKDELKKNMLNNNLKHQEINLKIDLYDYRNAFCEKYADFVIDCNNKGVRDIVKLTKQAFLGV